MAYWIEPVDRLPDGVPWMFVEEPNGDIRFQVDRNAEAFILPDCVTRRLIDMIDVHVAATETV